MTISKMYGTAVEKYLKECGFKSIYTYSSYRKEIAVNDRCEMFIYECSI